MKIDEIRPLKDYQLISSKLEGASSGSVYNLVSSDKKASSFIIKEMDIAQTISEYVGANFARLIAGNKAPLVTLTQDSGGKVFIASKFIDNFKTMFSYFKDTNLPQECFPNGCIVNSEGKWEPIIPYLEHQVNQDISGKVEENESVENAILFTQHTDAHDKNKGVIINGDKIQAAIVDFSYSMGRVWNDLEQKADIQTRAVFYHKDSDPKKILDSLKELCGISEKQVDDLLDSLFANLEKAYPLEKEFLLEEQSRIREFISEKMEVFSNDKDVFEKAVKYNLKFNRSKRGEEELYNLRLDTDSLEKVLNTGDKKFIKQVLSSSLSGLESSIGQFSMEETFRKLVEYSADIPEKYRVDINVFLLALENKDYGNAKLIAKRKLSLENLNDSSKDRLKAILEKGDYRAAQMALMQNINANFIDSHMHYFPEAIKREIEEFRKYPNDYAKYIEKVSEAGYGQYSQEVYRQEGIDLPDSVYNWRIRTRDQLQNLNYDPNLEYKIPPITHSVYFTYETNPKMMRDLYIKKYTDTSTRLSAADPKFRHIIWTNNHDSVPDEIKKLPGVEIRSMEEFKDHPLMPNLKGLIEDGQKDGRKFVEAST